MATERKLTYPLAMTAGLGIGSGLGALLFFGYILAGSLLVIGSVALALWSMERSS